MTGSFQVIDSLMMNGNVEVTSSFVPLTTSIRQVTTSAMDSTTNAVVIGCSSNADCNNQGICQSNGGCSCLSGFGGPNCVDIPDDSFCSSNDVGSNSVAFSPVFAFTIASSKIFLDISVPYEVSIFDYNNEPFSYSEDTLISFDGDSEVCDYPSSPSNYGVWNNPSVSDGTLCADQYSLALTWNQMQADCGFTRDEQNEELYTQTVHLSRRYSIPFGSSVVNRTSTVSQALEVYFPSDVTVSTSILVKPPVSVSVSALLSAEYDLPSNQWIVEIKTYTNAPYQLAFPSVSTSGDIFDDNRLISGLTTIVNDEACNSNSEGCEQTTTLYLSSCEETTGYIYLNHPSVCSGGEGNTCPPIADSTEIIVYIHFGSACPITDVIDISVSSLSSFSDDTFSQSQVVFPASEIAYFLTQVSSNDAVITSKDLVSVCYVHGQESCTAIAFDEITSPNDNPAFSVNLAPVYQLAIVGGEPITIFAEIDVEWQDARKRSTSTKSMSVSITSSFKLVPSEDEESTKTNGSSSFLPSVLLVSIAAILSFFF